MTSEMPSKQHLLLGLTLVFLSPLEALPAFNASSIAENEIEVGEYGTKQTVKCYDQFNGYGNSLTLKYPVSDLWTYNWDNKISSCCFTGFWLMYEYRDYNQFNSNVSFHYILLHFITLQFNYISITVQLYFNYISITFQLRYISITFQ